MSIVKVRMITSLLLRRLHLSLLIVSLLKNNFQALIFKLSLSRRTRLRNINPFDLKTMFKVRYLLQSNVP